MFRFVTKVMTSLFFVQEILNNERTTCFGNFHFLGFWEELSLGEKTYNTIK